MQNLPKTIRALTVKKPWGSLIARGRKCIEVRSQASPWMIFEGMPYDERWVVIHQGKGWDPNCESLATAVGLELFVEDYKHAEAFSGSIVALAFVVRVKRLESNDPNPNLYAMRPCSKNMFGLYLSSVQPARKPVPVIGQLGLWTIDREYIEAADVGHPLRNPIPPDIL